jgi:lipopolysaccharide biosynthesis glycosyltransferase
VEKRLIVTRADDNHKEISEITHPIITRYAEKCNSDFITISDPKDVHPHYRILQIYSMFDEYDSILSLDTDTLILNRCPVIFDVVPSGMIGSIFEDKGTRQEDRKMRIRAVQKKSGNVVWSKGYINTGVALFPKECREIFKYENKDDLWDGLGYDDVWLGYMIHKLHFKVFELPFEYNFMSMFQEPWNNSMSRFHANIIHYAGNGFLPLKSRLDNIKEDYLILKKYGML